MVSDLTLYSCLLLHPSQSWVSEIKREENARLFHDPEAHPGVEDHLPPVRGSDSCPHSSKVGLSGIGSIDWDKGGDCDLQGYISPVDQSKPLWCKCVGFSSSDTLWCTCVGFFFLVTPDYSSSPPFFSFHSFLSLSLFFYFWCDTRVYLGPHT